MKELSLFTGMGGGIYGSMILGWETVAYVEQNKYCQKVIAQRIQDGWFDNGEIYGDIAEFNRTDAHKYTGQIDILTGGFPCQPHSVAGKREGTSDGRWLFDEIIKTIEIVRPKSLLFENVAGILTDPAIILIYEALESIGYEASAPLLLGSNACGNVHKRERVWIFAKSKSIGQHRRPPQKCRNERSIGQPAKQKGATVRNETTRYAFRKISSVEQLLADKAVPQPLLCRVDDELPDWRKQLKAIGNGQDPIVMATAYNLLSEKS